MGGIRWFARRWREEYTWLVGAAWRHPWSPLAWLAGALLLPGTPAAAAASVLPVAALSERGATI